MKTLPNWVKQPYQHPEHISTCKVAKMYFDVLLMYLTSQLSLKSLRVRIIFDSSWCLQNFACILEISVFVVIIVVMKWTRILKWDLCLHTSSVSQMRSLWSSVSSKRCYTLVFVFLCFFFFYLSSFCYWILHIMNELTKTGQIRLYSLGNKDVWISS